MTKDKPKQPVESEALKLHREMYEKRRKSLEDLRPADDTKLTEDQKDTDRDAEEDAALLNF